MLTLAVRLVAQTIEIGLLITWGRTNISSFTDRVTALVGFCGTFCSGAIFHAIILKNAKPFVKFLKKLECFDLSHEGKKVKIKFSCFISYNLLFMFSTILFSLSLVVSYLLTPVKGQTIIAREFPHVDNVLGSHYPIIIVSICALIFIFMESATVFPIFQLGKAIDNVELRLKDIYDAIFEHADTKPRPELELLLNVYTNGNWAEKRAFAHKLGILQGGSKSDSAKLSQFWKRMCHRYLDFEELFQSFLNFSGAYFIVIYPTQILSAVAILYMNTTGVLDEDNAVGTALNLITGLGLFRIWAMSSVGHGIEHLHSQILLQTLRTERDNMLDEDERIQVFLYELYPDC